MDGPSFGVTYDYRCPFARNAHEHLVLGLADGADWNVEFVPFSLSQVHADEGSIPVWDDPTKADGLLAMEAGLVVRDRYPDHFSDVHLALFSARHDEARDLREESVVRDVLSSNGVDEDAVMNAVKDGWPREAFRHSHEEAVSGQQVFGVPTFIQGGRAAFVRLMERPAGNTARARATIERVLDLLTEHPELNEFKHTSLGR